MEQVDRVLNLKEAAKQGIELSTRRYSMAEFHF